jgi:hypothetical protein
MSTDYPLLFASALTVKRLTTLPVTFSSSDARLRVAARDEGLAIF